jgi:hypothetical protein
MPGVTKFIALMLLLTLPLQGYSALAMPFCEHQSAHDSARHADPAMHDQEQQPDRLACDDCAFCQLCASPALLPVAEPPLSDSGGRFRAFYSPRFVLFVPEQHERPPLTSAL